MKKNEALKIESVFDERCLNIKINLVMICLRS